MILGRSELLELIREKNLIESFSDDSLGGAGYDLRLDKIYRLASNSMLGVTDRRTPDVKQVDYDSYTLGPGDYVLVETLEKVNMPADVAARVLNRSTLFRCGVSLFNAFIDPGFKGTLTFGMKNLSNMDFTVERGSRIAQVIFEKVSGDTIEYDGKYQGGKVV
ncbi:dCTP deaminase [Candidatus Altiarchaeota archaeon]